jgi:hypothetical protein
VVPIPSALVVTRAASRHLHQRLLVLAISRRHNNPITQPRVPRVRAAAHTTLRHRQAFPDPRLSPGRKRFPAPPPRRPRPACSRLSPSWSTAPQRADNSAPTSPLGPAFLNGPTAQSRRRSRGRRRRLAATPGLAPDGFPGRAGPIDRRCISQTDPYIAKRRRNRRLVPAEGFHRCHGPANVRPCCQEGTPAGPGAEELPSWTARRCRWRSSPAAPRRN